LPTVTSWIFEQKEKTDVVQVATPDHLGTIAGLVDKLKPAERVDARVPISKRPV
jgi:hypothetical protein